MNIRRLTFAEINDAAAALSITAPETGIFTWLNFGRKDEFETDDRGFVLHKDSDGTWTIATFSMTITGIPTQWDGVACLELWAQLFDANIDPERFGSRS